MHEASDRKRRVVNDSYIRDSRSFECLIFRHFFRLYSCELSQSCPCVCKSLIFTGFKDGFVINNLQAISMLWNLECAIQNFDNSVNADCFVAVSIDFDRSWNQRRLVEDLVLRAPCSSENSCQNNRQCCECAS